MYAAPEFDSGLLRAEASALEKRPYCIEERLPDRQFRSSKPHSGIGCILTELMMRAARLGALNLGRALRTTSWCSGAIQSC